jgi:hypothetical protein
MSTHARPAGRNFKRFNNGDASCQFDWDRNGYCILYNQPSSYCTSFGSRNVSYSLTRWVTRGGRAIGQLIPSAGVLLGQVLRFFVEPTVPGVRVRFDDPVLDPSYQCMLTNLEPRRHLLLRQHASFAETLEARSEVVGVHKILYAQQASATAVGVIVCTISIPTAWSIGVPAIDWQFGTPCASVGRSQTYHDSSRPRASR